MNILIIWILVLLLNVTSFAQIVPSTKESSIANISEDITNKANKGIPFYQFTLGKCYLYGRGTEKNYQKAVE